MRKIVVMHVRVPVRLREHLKTTAALRRRSLSEEVTHQLLQSSAKDLWDAVQKRALETELSIHRTRFKHLRYAVECAVAGAPGWTVETLGQILEAMAPQPFVSPASSNVQDSPRNDGVPPGHEMDASLKRVAKVLSNMQEEEKRAGKLQGDALRYQSEALARLVKQQSGSRDDATLTLGAKSRIRETRRLNLNALLVERGRGARSRLSKQLDVTPGYVSHLLADYPSANARPIDDALARRIEKQLGVDTGQLDKPSRFHPRLARRNGQHLVAAAVGSEGTP